jgi:carboxyl-terminal processing protease
MLRGPKGTVVNLEIVRKGEAEVLQFQVIRDKIPIFSLDAAYEVKPGLVYLRLNRFSMTSIQEIRDAMAKFKKKPSKMILDLRDNAGGVLQASIDLANQFFDKGYLLVYNEGLHWPKTMEISTDEGFFKKGKLAMLIDEGSASASEIVAGAIQDWDRGTLIGRRSFGKGLVQQLMPLPDGSQIRLTVARYHTPTGRAIQRPYDAGHIEKYYDDLYKRYSNGEIYSKDSIRFPDSLKYYTLKEKRLVYGVGGIMPDVFMPLDTTYYSVYYSRLVRMGLLHQFVLQYMDENRADLKKQYKKFADFDRKYEVSEALFESLLSYAESQKLPRNNDDIAISAPEMKVIHKSYNARNLWDTNAYFEIVNKRDKVFQKAVELLLTP